MSPPRSDQYFFDRGNQARCRYLLWGSQGGETLRHFFAEHSASFCDYVQSQAWPWDAAAVRQSLDVIQHYCEGDHFVKVDLPHSLLDAYRGLLWIERGLSNQEAYQGSPRSSAWQDEEAQVFVKEVRSIALTPDKTLSMQILGELLPGIQRPVRLVKQFRDQTGVDPLFGNPFFTLDFDIEQLQKILAGTKERWRRFLQIAEQKVLTQLAQSKPIPHDAEAILVTSVGSLDRLGLTNLYRQCHTLVMYPSRVPEVALTITLYSYKGLLTCVVSGLDLEQKAKSLFSLLLRNKWSPLAERFNQRCKN